MRCPRRKITDRQIIESTINLSQSCLLKEEQEDVYKLLVKYTEAFSPRDEIGTCPNIEVDLQVIDKSSFFIRSFHVIEEDKPMIDIEMQRLVHLCILKKDMSPCSLITVISRKNSSLKRIITGFRFLNSILQIVNLAFPLTRDAFAILRSSKCECLSVLDLNDAYHTRKLLENSRLYCGIYPYFGSASYVYQRMPNGLSARSAIWHSYTNAILSRRPDRSKYLAIMDDLLLNSSKHSHLK